MVVLDFADGVVVSCSHSPFAGASDQLNCQFHLRATHLFP